MARVMALVVLLVWAAGAGGCISSRWRSGDAQYVSYIDYYDLLASFPPVTLGGDVDYEAVLVKWESDKEPRISLDGGLGLAREEFIQAAAYLRDADVLVQVEELPRNLDRPVRVVWTGRGVGGNPSSLNLPDADYGLHIRSEDAGKVPLREGVAYRLRIKIRNARSDAPVTLTPRLWVLGFRFVL